MARSSADRNAQDTPAARPADDRSLAVATIRANRSPSPPALDSGFFRQLDDRLTNNEKTKLQELSGGELLAGKRLDDLLGDVLDVKDVIVEANSICARIRVFESEQATSLPPPTVPTPGAGRPSVRAIGWGDLIVARERLVGYQAQEIAHIENVLPGEDKVRKHERTRTVEQVTETTTVTEDTRERDLQTTDRHELQNQVNEVIDEKFSVKAGVNLSGRYGVTTVNTSNGAERPKELPDIAPLIETTSSPRRRRKLQQSIVLWVDDNPENNLYERRALEALGINIDLANDTQDALRKLAHKEYDLVISDRGRPSGKQAGYELLKLVRDSRNSVPFII